MKRRVLRDDVGRDLIFDKGDAVAQLQLALLQPLQPQQIRRRRLMQGIDRRVEITVLLLQPRKLGLQLALIFVGHDIRQLKKREEMRTAVGPEEISSLAACSASLQNCNEGQSTALQNWG
jgi:hypothetical protein